jgi:antibiotic biosynthesis monooxygenase (ABM) superfamily enzyme
MITRTWRGWTTPENASTYETLLREKWFPALEARNVPGYRGISLLRRDFENEVEFMTIMWFDDLESVKAMAGPDYDIPVLAPEAKALFVRYDERAAHYETVVAPV